MVSCESDTKSCCGAKKGSASDPEDFDGFAHLVNGLYMESNFFEGKFGLVRCYYGSVLPFYHAHLLSLTVMVKHSLGWFCLRFRKKS